MAARVVVIGHHPAYLFLAATLGADAFSLPPDLWATMTEAERWAANRDYLDRAIDDGAVFVLASRVDRLRPSYFALELEYLIAAGYVERRGSTHWEMTR